MNWTSQRLTGCRLPQRWSSSGTWLNVDVRIAIEIPPSSITIAWQQFNINLLKIAWKCLFLSKSCVRTSIIVVIDQILASRTNCFFFLSGYFLLWTLSSVSRIDQVASSPHNFKTLSSGTFMRIHKIISEWKVSLSNNKFSWLIYKQMRNSRGRMEDHTTGQILP